MAHFHLNLPWIVDSFPQFKFYIYPHCMPLLICICKIVDVWKAFPYFSGEKNSVFWFVISSLPAKGDYSFRFRPSVTLKF